MLIGICFSVILPSFFLIRSQYITGTNGKFYTEEYNNSTNVVLHF